MASVKITELTSSGPLTGSEVLPIVQGIQTVKTTAQDIANLAGGGLAGTQYVYVAADGTDVENAAELQAAYATAQTMSPSATNRITIVAAPGNYNFDITTFKMYTQYIDLVSLDGNKSIIFNSSNVLGTLWVTADNVFVKGVDVQTKSLSVGDSLSNTIIENCKGGNYSFGFGGNILGTFIDCEGGDYSFAAKSSSFAPFGTLDNGLNVDAGGTFINCKGGDYSFGATSFVAMVSIAYASGTFTNCTAGSYSFGNHMIQSSIASGTFTNCIANSASFGHSSNFSLASGTFTNCKSGAYSFGAGSSGANANGTFNNCIGDGFSFGYNGDVSGVFSNCVGGNMSWFSNQPGGTVTGKLYFSRHTFSQSTPAAAPGGAVVAFITSSNTFIS